VQGGTELTVYTVSDASGETAELVAKAAALQFKGHAIKLVRLPRARTPDQIGGMITLAAQTPCLIAFTMVDATLRSALQTEARRKGLPAVDILDPLIKCISLVLGAEPLLEPGLLHHKDEQYFNRMDAIDFAIKYDDGKDPKGMVMADLVLVGVSRTSKTPTCMYLAQNRGIKASNVPLVLNVPPPQELFGLPAGRVIGLTLNSRTLTEIRTARLQNLGLGPSASYANQDHINRELEYAEGIFRRLRCPVVDVTHKAIEETAAEILEITQRKETYVV
jgi:regulator of PEP synthase PpsR (kinase-PPPase family)